MEKLHEIDRHQDAPPAHNNLHVEEMHKPSNFHWPMSAGTGENFVPHLTLHDGGQPIDGKSLNASKGIAAHHDAAAAKPDAAHHESQDKSAAWTVKKGETLYGKAEQELHAHGKPNAHYSPEDIRKEVAANAERNNWMKSADSAHSPDEQHRRAQFDAYVKDGKASHLPKDLNGMVHKSNQEEIKPAIGPEGKASPKPVQDGSKAAAAHQTPEITDINGHACKVQPTGEQIPTLSQKANGCEYRDPSDPKHPENKDLANVVNRGKESTVGIDVRTGPHAGGSGTGVIIGHSQDGSKVYVATDNHVASPEVNPGGEKAKSREVTMPDGKHYPAQLALKEPGTDRAVLAVEVGAGNADKYRAAEFGDKPGEKGKGVILGFPRDSHTLYASPATLNGEIGSNQMFHGEGGMLKGEKANRLQIDMPKTHTEEGVSGAPIFNHQGQVIGLLEGGSKINPSTQKHEYWSYGNPTTKSEVQNWLTQIQAAEAKRQK
jgi:S1-C subfamily serine protease